MLISNENTFLRPISKVLILLSILLASSSQLVFANKSGVMMPESSWDEALMLNINNHLERKASGLMEANRLCPAAQRKSGVGQSNSKTIREFLGPKLKSIDVLETKNFETMALFHTACEAISNALQKSPKNVYRYEPWANVVSPEFIGRLNYDDGIVGELQLTYNCICFQDHEGRYWWARFANPDDLNLKRIQGTIGFKSGTGYFLEEKNGHRIWLQMTEDKFLAQKVQDLVGKLASVSGELRRLPMNVTANFPKGADCFIYGFTITTSQ